MTASDALPHLIDSGCLTPFGDDIATHRALIEGRLAIAPHPVLGAEGGDSVPLALLPGRCLDETANPAWLGPLQTLAERFKDGGWGQPRRPVIVTSSNFGVGSLYAFRRADHDPGHLDHGTPCSSTNLLRRHFGWGPDVTIYSHACVSAHLGLLQATRRVASNTADEVLVFSYDFLSPFVTGGFHALKILNEGFPAPYQRRETGSIALGDGAAYAIVGRRKGDFRLTAQRVYNEHHHFTANRPDGTGFRRVFDELGAAAKGRRVWLKGHGTGTLEAGRLEAEAFAAVFPDAPLVGWKGSLGHTLGSCGLVELAIAVQCMRTRQAPGTVGTQSPCFTPNVATSPLNLDAMDAVVCASNAFGGAHAAFILSDA